jgi:putative peptidoglycan lipid II flippase
MTQLAAMTADPRDPHRDSSSPRIGRLAGAALLLSVSFVLSRLLGVLRFTVIAAIFDNSSAINAYFAAFRIPDTMFTLVSGAALTSAFVPTFAGLLELGEDDEAWELASTILNTVAVVFALLAVFAFLLAPQLMSVVVGGFSPEQRDLTVHLTRIMLLQPIFLGVAAIITSILQTRNRFLLTGLAPLVYNGTVILGALFFGAARGVDALAWAVVIGAILYLVVQLPAVQPDAIFRRTIDWGSGAAREVLRLFGPRMIGLAAFQIMLLITLYLAAGLPAGTVGAINYSWPLIQFPVGALGTAAGTAIFPTLSRLSAVDDLLPVRRTLNRTLRLIIFLSFPAAMGLIVLRRPIINLLYAHGQWTHADSEQTAFALIFFAIALGPLSLIEVLARMFYAMKDTLTPVRIAIVAVVIDAVLSILFVHVFPRASGQGGLALATAIASTVQVVWLTRALEVRLNGIGRESLLATLRVAAFASLVMGMVLYIALDPLVAVLPQHGLGALATVCVTVGLGGITFGGVAYALGAPELMQAGSFLRRPRTSVR